MRTEIATPSHQQAEAFDRLLDIIAEEIVERYLAELEAADDNGGASLCHQ